MRWLCLLLLVGSAAWTGLAADPSAEEIIRRLVERSESREILQARQAFSYRRATETLFFNDEEKVKRKVQREYRVDAASGRPVTRLVAVDGKPVDPKNAEHKQWQSEAGDNARQMKFDASLVQRYQFTLVGREEVEGRTAFLLDFEPLSDPPDTGGFFGKLLNRLEGQLWVDAEDYQLARADVRLREKVNFFGGVAGKIEKMSLQFAARRLAPGAWFTKASAVEIAGRRLFSALRFKASEVCDQFEQRAR